MALRSTFKLDFYANIIWNSFRNRLAQNLCLFIVWPIRARAYTTAHIFRFHLAWLWFIASTFVLAAIAHCRRFHVKSNLITFEEAKRLSSTFRPFWLEIGKHIDRKLIANGYQKWDRLETFPTVNTNACSNRIDWKKEKNIQRKVHVYSFCRQAGGIVCEEKKTVSSSSIDLISNWWQAIKERVALWFFSVTLSFVLGTGANTKL